MELPDDGEGTITDEGELAVAAPGRSIVLATWEADGSDPVEVIDGLRSQERPPAREEYREDGPEGTRRWAVLLDEEDEGRPYHGLYGYVLAPAEWLQVAVLFDDDADLPEALHVWRSVRHADG